MVSSQQVSRAGGEQHLVITHDGTEYEARLRTVYYAEEDEERDEYVLGAEDVPEVVAAEVEEVNAQLAERGEDVQDEPDAEDDQEEIGDQEESDEAEA